MNKFVKFSSLLLIVGAFIFATQRVNSQIGQQQTPAANRNAQGAARVNYSEIFSVDSLYEYRYFEEMVEGGDGYKLLTRIYLPKGDGPWPVLVTRTPYVYGGRGDNNAQAREYAKRGIGYIQQDCRGKGGSEGFYSPNIYEREDGLALYEWLDKQSWCKSIGIFGSSYTALTGWIVGDIVPDKVKGFYLQHYGVDRHISCYRAGLFRVDIMSGWAIDNAEEDIKVPELKEGQARGENYYDFYRYLPEVEADVAILGQRLDWYRDWISHTDYNDPYWNSGVWADLKNAIPKIKVPVTIVAGQFDHHEEGTILGYERLNPDVKANSRLILGSWNHSSRPVPTHVPYEHARDYNMSSDMFAWFYSILVKGVVPKGEIRVYVVEEDKWINLDKWPIEAVAEKNFYFTSQKNDNGNSYLLSDTKQSKSEIITYQYDPQDPVMAIGGETLFTSSTKTGSHLQPEAGFRKDVISFISKPLTEDLTIGGTIKVHLLVSTDVDDTAFAFTMSEVTPDGKSYNMRTSITTLGYRNDMLANRQTYTPNEKVEIVIESLPIAWNVKAGNAIRIDIKSSNFPEYAVHTNYAGVWSEQTKTRVANQSIYIGSNNISRVSIPIMEF